MAFQRGGSTQQVVSEGLVPITVIDDTAAGMRSVEANVNKGLGAIDAGAKKATTSVNSVGPAASKAGAMVSSAFASAGQGLQAFAAGTGKVPPALGAVTSSLGRMVPAVGGALAVLTAGVALFDEWATQTDAARKATISMQISIDGARDAFGGLVSDMDLAKQGNKAFALGVAQNGVEFAAVARGVSAIAMNLGEDNLQLLDNANTAIGRGSALILDNLGIILNDATANKMYADYLGKSVSKLNDLERAQSFAWAAKMKIAEAGKAEKASVDGVANSYLKAKTALDTYRQGVLGLNTDVGKVRETMRAMSPEVIQLFGSRQREDIGAINRELAKQAEAQARMAREFGDTNAKASDFLLTYEDVLAVADELGNVELMRSGLLDYENRKKREAELNRLSREALAYQEKITEKGEKEARNRRREDKVKTLKDEAATLDHQAKLLGFQAGKEGEILMLQVEANRKRLDAATLINDQNAALEYQREIELALAAPLKKQSGGGTGPTEADRVKAAGEAVVQLMQHEVELAELTAQIRGTEAADAFALGVMRVEAADAALELELQVLDVTRAKNSVERQTIENRRAAIERERDMLDVERRAEERKASDALIAQAIADTEQLGALRAEQAKQETERLADVISLEQARIAREEQRIRSVGAARAFEARSDLERLRVTDETEAAMHAIKLRQIAEEHRARMLALEAREAQTRGRVADSPVEREQQLGELRQVEHDKQIERMNLELALARAKDAEEARLAASQRARLRETIGTVEESIGAVSQLYGQASEFAGFVSQQRAGEAEADLARTTSALEARGRAQQRQLEAELKSAEGNAARQGEIRRKAARMQADIQAKIEKAQADHAERTRRIESRIAGAKLLIDGAVNAAKAVSAFASYNFVQGALYTAAAAFNFAQGGMLMAGQQPGAGGGGGSIGAGGVGGGAGFDRETSAAARTPGSTVGEAARRSPTPTLAGGQSGSMVNVERIEVLGGLDEESAEKIARALDKVSKTREGAAA